MQMLLSELFAKVSKLIALQIRYFGCPFSNFFSGRAMISLGTCNVFD